MITALGNADFAMDPMLFDRSIVISATFRRIPSGNNISFSMTSDGFVPFIIAMTVCFPPCPSLLWRMVYTSWQNKVSSKPKWPPCSREVAPNRRHGHAAAMTGSRRARPCSSSQRCRRLSNMCGTRASRLSAHCPSATFKKSVSSFENCVFSWSMLSSGTI